jgi:DNA-binding winged helix-turn-helix (wHTH) protein/Tol biopolymer transport system component
MGSKSFVFRFDDVEVREREFSLVKADQALTVEPKAFRVLLFLLRNPQRLVSKEELLNAVWGDVAVGEGSLTRCIWMLRNALGDDTRGTRSRYIETVPTVGYRFICKVVASEETPGEPEVVVEPNDLSGNETKVGKKVGAWVLTGCVVLALCGTAAFWYLHRSLPPLRVTGTNPITNDDHGGWIAGTDGARIYFNHDPPTSTAFWGVSMVSVSGGEIQKLRLGVGPVLLWDVSRDGSNLLVGSLVESSLEHSALWSVDVPGGPAHFITKVEKSWSFRWSPDGKYIAYSPEREGQPGLYVMGRDGADVHKLVAAKVGIWDLAWSPDGSRIRFTDGDSLWEVSSAGTNLHPVFPKWKGPAGQCCGQWTSDGDFYLFLAGSAFPRFLWTPDGEFSSQIWALDERHHFLLSASPDPVQLTSGPIRWERPIPSKDGNKIFARGTTTRGELVRFDQTSKQLRPFLGGISAEFLTYSKDRAQIAYVTYPDGILWRAKADGTERLQLTNPPLYPILCRWSPDGSQILFEALHDPTAAQPDPSPASLYVMPAQGGALRPLLSGDDGRSPGDGVWSPDGRRVLYAIGPNGQKDRSLRIFDLDSGKVSEVPGSNGLYSPRWSPDGRYFAAMPRSCDTIRLFEIQTQQWSTLVEHRGIWGFPTWSHDSKFLYALNFPADKGPPSVSRIAVPGGTPQRVVDLRDVPLIGAVNFWFGLDPDDTPLLLRDNGTNDIYSLALDRK